MTLAAIRPVGAGGTYIDRSIARQLRAGALPELTPPRARRAPPPRRGRSNKKIAQALRVGEETVKTHVARVLATLEADNRAHAVVQALRLGLVSIDGPDAP